MKNWNKTLRNKYNYDLLPKQTKLLTFTLMPIGCILFIWVSIYLNGQANKTKEDYQFLKGEIVNAIRQDEKNDKEQVSNFVFEIKINQTDLFLSSNHLTNSKNISLIEVGKIAEVYFDTNDNTITQMYIDNQKILDINDYNGNLKSSRNVTMIFGSLFTLWFLSRLLRYRKYVNLN